MKNKTSTLLALPLLLTLGGAANASVISAEDDGSINLANFAGFGSSFTLQGTIGNGPFGTTSGDYDYFRFNNLLAGWSFSAATISAFDPIIGLYNSAGTLLVYNDDGNGAGGSANIRDSFIGGFAVPSAGSYFLMVRGYGSNFQSDPFNSASGGGVGETGAYRVTVTIVPEPVTLALVGLGLAGIGYQRKHRPTA